MSNQLTDAVAIDDDRAVAPVIGFVILFGFLIITLSLYQAQAVPQQNSEVEFQHFEEARNDLVELRAGILQAGSTDQSQYRTVRLGTTYPTRMFAINPPPPAGTIRTTEAYPITIEKGSENVTIPTRFVQYQPGYNELDRSSMWYDASVLYVDAREGEGGVAVIEDQELVADDGSVRVVAVQNEFRRSGVSRVTLELRPAEGVTGRIPEGDLNVTVPTRLSDDEYWDESGISSDAYSVTDDTNGDGVHNLTIETTASNLTVDTVGVQEAPEDPTQNDNARTGGSGDAPDDEDEDDSVGSVPEEAVAYADADDDLEYDSGETTYTESELSKFDKDVNLVIPSDVGGGELSDGKISITADRITSRVDYETTNDGVTLNTKNAGPVDITGSTIDSEEKVKISKATSATLDDVTITRSGKLLIEKVDEISATNADITTNNDGVTLDAESAGPVDITGSTIDSEGATEIPAATRATLDDVTITDTGKLSVTADEISGTNADITTNNDGVTLDAESAGPVDITGSTVDSEGATEISAATKATLDGVTITRTGKLLIEKVDEISATNADITTNNDGVTLDAESAGPVDITGSTIDSEGATEIPAATEATLDDVTITGNGKLLIEKVDEISATNADITTEGKVKLIADGGPIQASGIQADAQGKIRFDAGGNIAINDTADQGSEIFTSDAAKANFDSSSRTFFIDGVEISDDDDDTLSYSPNDVTVNGTTETGSVDG